MAIFAGESAPDTSTRVIRSVNTRNPVPFCEIQAGTGPASQFEVFRNGAQLAACARCSLLSLADRQTGRQTDATTGDEYREPATAIITAGGIPRNTKTRRARILPPISDYFGPSILSLTRSFRSLDAKRPFRRSVRGAWILILRRTLLQSSAVLFSKLEFSALASNSAGYRTYIGIIHNGLLLLYATDTLHDIVNVTGSKNWDLSCFKLTKDVFSEVMGALYVRQYTPQYLETLANRVGGLFERVKETVAERILVKSWLDEETRTQALLKLNSLRGRFHVWPGFYNESLLAREMAEVEIDPEDFFRTVLRRFRQIRTVDDKVLRRNVTEK
ncbi:hypothetical protein K0M31_016823 [Melipona bicolor]|uniref:Peptidase M13 N-terminal domain-containing protein n=1 Tax=Melipona bicolor TaxID=60889 RepID=A0AA40KEI1_9HYME|nr:hypothetical protein K0M31_016823 [Melipona bicolor]